MSVVTRSRLSAEFLDAFGGRDVLPPIVLEYGDTLAWGGPLDIADGTVAEEILFPQMTTLSTFWLITDKAVTICLGDPGSNQGRVYGPHGAFGFAGGAHPVSAGIFVTYEPGDDSVAHLRIFAAGA